MLDLAEQKYNLIRDAFKERSAEVNHLNELALKVIYEGRYFAIHQVKLTKKLVEDSYPPKTTSNLVFTFQEPDGSYDLYLRSDQFDFAFVEYPIDRISHPSVKFEVEDHVAVTMAKLQEEKAEMDELTKKQLAEEELKFCHEVIVLVNGKQTGVTYVSDECDEAAHEASARKDYTTSKILDRAEVIKTIISPKNYINFVVKNLFLAK